MLGRWSALLVALAAMLGGCGGGSSTDQAHVLTLEFFAVPSSAQEGQTMAPVRVRTLVDGVLDTSGTNVVNVTLNPGPTPRGLTGTMTRLSVAGVAVFDDLVVSGFGSDFKLKATSPGSPTATSSPFTVVQEPAAKLAVTSIVPATIAPFQGFDLTVELHTARDVRQEDATNTISLELSGGGPQLLWHASGVAPRVVEILDPSTDTVVKTLPSSVSDADVDGATYDPTTGLLYVSSTSGAFFIAQPATGDEARWADANTLSMGLKSLVLDDAGVLHAGSVKSANHYAVDLISGVDTLVGTFAMPGFILTGNNGFARNPITRAIFAVTKVSTGPRRLAKLDLASATLTDVGSLGDNFSSITHGASGALFGVTGDGATVPETLYGLDEVTAAKTLEMTLGNGGSGEVVVAIPRRFGGTPTATAIGGIATFHGLYVDQPGVGYVLTATSPGLAPVVAPGYVVSGAVVATATVQFQSASSLTAEDVAGGTSPVTLTLSAPQSHAIPVFLTIDATSTATAGGATPDTMMRRAFQVIVPPGETSVTFDVPIVDDALSEADETIVMTIRSANLASGIGAPATHTLTIQSNE